ncbi:MAG: hypothetical protein WCH31_01425 [Actinomycetes bacterium]
MRALLVLTAAVAVATPVARAMTPREALFSTEVGISMQRTYQAYGVRMTKVICRLPGKTSSGHCTARFTMPYSGLTGTFIVSAGVTKKSGHVHWKATSARCKVAKTGKPASCAPR